jgi:hypothetical protein
MALVITRIGVHDPPESMFKINWTECSRSTGIGVQDPPERANCLAIVPTRHFST